MPFNQSSHRKHTRCHHLSITPLRERHVTPSLVFPLLMLVFYSCVLPTAAMLKILRPPTLANSVQPSVLMPYGKRGFAGRPYRGALVWVPHHVLCSTVDEAAELDLNATLPKPVAHVGAMNYSEIYGAIALFKASQACPVLNQLFYAEVVLGVTGAVVHCGSPESLFPPEFDMLLTAPVTHIPAVVVQTGTYEILRSAVVDNGELVEASLGWSTSEMFYG